MKRPIPPIPSSRRLPRPAHPPLTHGTVSKQKGVVTNQLTWDLKATKARCKRLEAELRELDKTRTDLTTRIEEIQQLRLQLDDANNRWKSSQEEIRQSHDDHAFVVRQHNQLMDEARKLQEALHVGTTRNEELEERLTNATEAFEAMHKSYQQEAEAHKAMAAKFVHCQNELDSERAANNMLAQERDEYRKSLEEYRKRDSLPYDSNQLSHAVDGCNRLNIEQVAETNLFKNIRIVELGAAVGTEAVRAIMSGIVPAGVKLDIVGDVKKTDRPEQK